MNGSALITEFRRTGSEAAFRQIVERYTNLVFSVAVRRLSNAPLAQEVTQSVFVRLAQAGATFRSEGELVAWLHRTTIHVSIDLWRSEQRRRAREEHAATMEPTSNQDTVWDDIARVVDDALNDLNENDRKAILLRFFAEKPMREVGASLGVSEDAAKMRVSRALEKLRGLLGARGVACTAAALGAMLEQHAVQAAPPATVASVAALKLTLGGGTRIAARVLQAMLSHAVASASGVALVVLLSFVAVHSLSRLGDDGTANEHVAPTPVFAVVPAPESTAVNATAAKALPDPRMLLVRAAQARDRIVSGRIQFDDSIHILMSLDGIANDVKSARIKILFDGEKRRVERITRGSSYVTSGHEEEKLAREKQMIRDQRMDHAAAVRAGILEDYEERTITIYDGDTLFTYREKDGRSQGAVIEDASKAGAGNLFDPRVFGIGEFFFRQSAADTLGYENAKLIELVGEETVDGAAAWHVRVSQAWEGYSGTIDVWLDHANPTRVLRYERWLSFGQGIKITAKFNPAQPGDPLPIEINTLDYSRNELRLKRRMLRSESEYNISVEPSTWSLAGLGMAIGSSVSDNRVSRLLGYWNGVGLGESTSRPKTNTPAVEPVDLSKLVRILDVIPESPEAFDAAKWIILNTPDGLAVEKAAAVLTMQHIWDTNLVDIATKLEHLRHRSSTNLLEAMLEKNPSAAVKGNACFTLAMLWKEQSKNGKDRVATAAAETLFERAGREFGSVQRPNRDKLEDLAAKELYGLRRTSVGCPAPETQGVDLDGRALSLHDYRGKPVVLFWWSNSTNPYELKEVEKLLGRFPGRSATIISVHNGSDVQRAQSILLTNHFNWPTFQDTSRQLMKKWSVDGWPTVIVLDQQGVIRARGHTYNLEISKALEAMFARVEAK